MKIYNNVYAYNFTLKKLYKTWG